MRSKPVLFINGPLHGQYMEVREGNEYEIVQRNDDILLDTNPDALAPVSVTKLRYRETPIHENIYFLESDSKCAIYDNMKTILWYHKSNPYAIPDLPLKVIRALALNATLDEAKRKEIIHMAENV